MKAKLTPLLFVLLCLLLCLTLFVGMLLRPSRAAANEQLSPLPVLRGDSGLNPDYLSQLSDYVTDRFFLRQELISVRARLFSALGSSAAEDVLVGSGGWLYYAPTLSDYTGSGALSEGELRAVARNLLLMQEYCASRDIRFLFAAAPNKNSLYPEHMPSAYPTAQTRSALRLHGELDRLGVAYADLFSAFATQPEPLYYAHDSHWNQRGAALAADVINAAFGRESAYFADPFTGPETAHAGDLYEMLYPAFSDPETERTPARAPVYTRQGKETRPDSITIQTVSGGSGSLAAFRDSFGNALYPYLADSFAEARFSRSNAYDLYYAAEHGAEYVLVELVERNLRYLLTNVPVMPAPARQIPAPDAATGTVALRAEAAANKLGGVLWRGTLPEGYADGAVLLCCAGGAYEAYLQTEGGFAAYLPEGETPEYVCYEANGAPVVRAAG